MSDRLESLREMIESCDDVSLKEIYAMLYADMLYSQYISEIDPVLHKRALEYVRDTHGVNGVNFKIEEG